jgi:hypothetical protein
MSKDLLKEAIADAKAVRETAIANAKLALEEAFTPRLQSMLSHKIAEDTEEELSDEEEVDVAVENTDEEETDVVTTDENTEDEEEPAYTENSEEEDDMELSTEEEEMDDSDEMSDENDDDLELESIIKELEDEDEEEPAPTDENTEDPGDQMEKEDDNDAKPLSISEDGDHEESEDDEAELDLGEVIKALQEEDEEEVAADKKEDDLQEAYNTIKYLKAKINEVNLLNAKLLFSNKLFRGNSLNESQKMKVIETFDRANSVREVKLVYSTLAESLKGYKPGKKRQVTEGFASKATNSTKPNKNVIVESNNFSSRMKKLAGLL